jgi:hypothetical protein
MKRKAVYVDWHLPKKASGRLVTTKKSWEIAMIIRSTAYSKIFNNLSPVLYCDPETYDYYDEIGLLKHFDEVKQILPTEVNYNPSIFWAAGKFYAILDNDSPFVMIDLDAEIRFEIDFDGCDLFCTHLEGVSKNDLKFYPDFEYLDRDEILSSKFNIKWGELAVNTCILAFNDIDFSKKYAQSAIDFMESTININDSFSSVAYMVSLEQRFLYELAKLENKRIDFLIDGKYIPTNKDHGLESFENSNVDEIGAKGFLHVWGYKKQLNDSPELESNFTNSLISTSEYMSSDILYSVNMNNKLYITGYNGN